MGNKLSTAVTDSSAQEILTRLRDIHIPPLPDWWPPAFGWWMIFFTVSITSGVLLYRWLKDRNQRLCPAWHALNELDELWSKYQETHSPDYLLQGLSTLMRRTAISLDKHSQIASLTGKDWLEWLDQHFFGTAFSQGDGQVFADAPYRKASEKEVEILFALCEAWLEHNIKKRTLSKTKTSE